MSTYTINNVSGIPNSFRDTKGVVVGAANAVSTITCYNEREINDNGKPGPLMLVFKGSIFLTAHGFKNTQRAMSVRLSAKYADGTDLPGNPNELSNVLFLLCNYNNYKQEITFRCQDHLEGGSASKLIQVHFSFFYDPAAWIPC